MFGDKVRHFIQMVAGVYVFYLGIKLITGMHDGSADPRWYFYAFSFAFMVIGVFLVIVATKSLIKAVKRDKEEMEEANRQAREEAEKNSEEKIITENSSIKDRINAMSQDEDSGDMNEESTRDNIPEDTMDRTSDNVLSNSEDKTEKMKNTTFINSYKEEGE